MNNKYGFTLIELLIGMVVTSMVLLIATSLVVNIFTSNTKSKQIETLAQVKNDLQVEFSNTIRWADTISYVGNKLEINSIGYELTEGVIYKEGIALTPKDVEVTRFDIKKNNSQGATNTILNSGTGLTGQYFNNADFTDLVFSQQDFKIDFDWGVGSPDPMIDSNSFSAKYTGFIEAPVTGEYSFYIQSDDGARVFVDDLLLIDDFNTPGYNEARASKYLESGKKYRLRVEYVENFGNALLKLYWSYPGVSKQIVPTNRLYPDNNSGSVELTIDIRSKFNNLIVDTINLILSPRSGNIGDI